jgi:ABC-type transport system substrate-binding protein
MRGNSQRATPASPPALRYPVTYAIVDAHDLAQRPRRRLHFATKANRACNWVIAAAQRPRRRLPFATAYMMLVTCNAHNFYENYARGAEGNYNGYCNPEVDKLIDRQSAEADQQKRKELVWEIERKLAEDGARPIMFYDRRATCWQPRVKGLTMMVNSVFSGARMEDVWLDK